MPPAAITPEPRIGARVLLLDRQWWDHTDLRTTRDTLLLPTLPTLLDQILTGRLTQPATLYQ